MKRLAAASMDIELMYQALSPGVIVPVHNGSVAKSAGHNRMMTHNLYWLKANSVCLSEAPPTRATLALHRYISFGIDRPISPM